MTQPPPCSPEMNCSPPWSTRGTKANWTPPSLSSPLWNEPEEVQTLASAKSCPHAKKTDVQQRCRELGPGALGDKVIQVHIEHAHSHESPQVVGFRGRSTMR